MSDKVNVNVGGRTLCLTNLDKLMWPEEGIAKRDLIQYYVDVAPFLLPYLRDRPVVLTRYPDGVNGKAFFQKDKPNPTPEWVRTLPIYHSDADRQVNYILVDEPATLAWMANLACIEIHVWPSSAQSLDHPDYAVFDLDPAEGTTFDHVREVAELLRQALGQFSLRSYPKVTGATGLHAYVPLIPNLTYPQVQLCVEFLATMIRDAYPERVTLERVVKKRAGKVYIDYLQNIKGKTMVSVFSARPKPGAPVSFPIRWERLNEVESSTFTIQNAVADLEARGDPLLPLLTDRQDLSVLLRAAESYMSPKSETRLLGASRVHP